MGPYGPLQRGHLVQTLTNLSSYEIVKTIDFQLDEWTEHAKDYCEGTGHKVDDLFITLQNAGFGYQDVIHLENLSDKRVLSRLEGGRRHLRRNNVEDAILYMNFCVRMFYSM